MGTGIDERGQGHRAHVMHSLATGEDFAGYLIEGIAGQGGMGVVYRARDRELRRPIALKVIAPAFARDSGFRARFERESRLAAQIEHPNVIPVYRAGSQEDRLYIAMRFVEGSDLASRIADDGRLEAEDAARLLAQVARALDAAHARGLVHRDVKPANVLLGDPDRVYLTDFGLAVEGGVDSELTRTGQWVGTVAYVAPEQIRGLPVDARTDVYALGGVLHHCLTGRPPFPREHELDALAAHLGEPPPRPSELVRGLPSGFDHVVARALAKDPADRYPSAGDLGRAALAVARGEKLPRHERSVATGPAAWARRHPRALLLRVAAALFALGLAAGTAVALTGGDGNGRSSGTAANPAGRVVGKPIRLKLAADRMAAAGDRVWTLSANGGRTAAVNPATGRSRAFLPAVDLGGGTFPDIAAGAGSLWVSHDAEQVGGVDRIDAGNGEALEHIPLTRAQLVAFGAERVWATSLRGDRGELVAIDPGTNAVAGEPVGLGREPSDLAVGPDAIWVADARSDRLLRIDPRDREVVARIPVGDAPRAIAVAKGGVWVANFEDRTLSRIDPEVDEAIRAPIVLGKEIQDIAAAGDALWVAGADNTVTRLNPRTGRQVGTPLQVGTQPLTLLADSKGVWVAANGNGVLRRIESG